jgi:hypothetical protein
MKTNSLLLLASLALLSCKKKVEEPNYGTPHHISLGVKVNTASTSDDGIKSLNIAYTGAHGEFTKDRAFLKDSIHVYPKTWDTTFTAYNGGDVKYTVAVNSYNLKLYAYDDYTKADTVFLVAEPDRVNSLDVKVKD